MKKLSAIVLSLVMAVSMAACSDANTVSSQSAGAQGQGTTTTQGASQDPSDNGNDTGNGSVDVTLDTSGNFVFTYEGVDILMGSTDVDSVLAGLGAPKSQLEVPSCAHDGTDHVYTYDNMVLSVYVATGATDGYISDVMITSDLVATPEGLEIGMTKDDAREKYGDPDVDSDTSWIYKRGTSELLITFNADSIISLEYMIP